MHVIGAIALLSGLIWYAFGPVAARAFVGLTLALGAAAVLLLIGIAAFDIRRQEAQQRPVSHFQTRMVQDWR
ncbi:MAG: hypothetical protein AAGL98_00190 [Planctomycetota bacterium]